MTARFEWQYLRMAARYPPLPLVFRVMIWPLRILATLASLLAIFVILFMSTWGEPGIPGATLIALFGFTLLMWIHPLSPWFLGVLGAIAIGSILTGNPVGGLVGIGLVALLWWMRRRGGGLFQKSQSPPRLEPTTPDASMVGARRHIRAFEQLGFERAGAYRARLGPVWITVSLLVDDALRAYASVTDAVINVTSLFPADRGLVTRNSELRALPPHLLVNSEPGASPDQLVDSHRRALELVAEKDHFPISVDPSELVDIAIESERRVAGWTPPSSFSSDDWAGPLWRRGGRYQQIDDWHGTVADPDHSS